MTIKLAAQMMTAVKIHQQISHVAAALAAVSILSIRARFFKRALIYIIKKQHSLEYVGTELHREYLKSQ